MAHDDNSKKDPADTAVSEETLLKLSKEIAVKFIEVGRITPANFPTAFKDIHTAIRDSLGRDKA
jgi:hypothetical protein